MVISLSELFQGRFDYTIEKILQPDCEISRFVKCLKISVNSWNDHEGLSPNLTKPYL